MLLIINIGKVEAWLLAWRKNKLLDQWCLEQEELGFWCYLHGSWPCVGVSNRAIPSYVVWHIIFLPLELTIVWFTSGPLVSCSIRFLWIPKSYLHLEIASVLMQKSLPVSIESNFCSNCFKKAWIFNIIPWIFAFLFFAYRRRTLRCFLQSSNIIVPVLRHCHTII